MEGKNLRQTRAKRRFKALVRLVIANREWLMDVDTSDSALKKGVQMLTRRRKSQLELKHKALLNKSASSRTEEEKNRIYRVIGGFKCFRKYPEHVKMLLAGFTYFAYYGPGRVIVKQNHKAQALYFIITGEVAMTVSYWDNIMNEEVTTNMGTLAAGNLFGEDSLLNDLPRQATMTTITSVEFILLFREDFNLILRDTLKQEWDYMSKAMRSFSYFDSWDNIAISECCMFAKIKSYEKDDTILGDGKGNKNWVYFVLKGTCSVIEHLLVVPYYDGKDVKYKLHNADDSENLRRSSSRRVSITTELASRSVLRTSRSTMIENRTKSRLSMIDDADDVNDEGSLFSFASSKVETKFMQVCIFSKTACFGLGEQMDRRRIVALEKVECLAIPRYFILSKGQVNIWTRILVYLNQHIPTTKEVFFEFQEQLKWRKATNELVNSVPKIPCNVPQNVPYSIRIKCDFDYKPTSTVDKSAFEK